MTERGSEERSGAHNPNEASASLGKKDRILAIVARPARRSPLFWWLLDHHDELVSSEINSGLGLPWEELFERFDDLGLTLCGGRPVTPRIAKQTWRRVRKEKPRLEARLAAQREERAARSAANPRNNMPSRFPKGEYPAPLADGRPSLSARRSSTSGRPPLVPSGSGAAWTETILKMDAADEFVRVFEEKELDLRWFIKEDERPWERDDFTPEQMWRVLKSYLGMRFDFWKQDRRNNPNNPIDNEWRRRRERS